MRIAATDHLESLSRQLDAVSERARTLTAELDEAQRLWRPEPERWGVADCFEHLVATGAAYHPRIRTAIGEGPPPDEPARYRPRLFGRLFIYTSGPNSKMRIRGRGAFVPPAAEADAPERFLDQQRELAGLLRDAAGVDLQRVRITSPLSRLLTLTLGESLHMLVAHQQRHLGQAERVLAEPGFPAAGQAALSRRRGARPRP